MPRIALSAAALLALAAGSAHAQSIEFRIIERQGQAGFIPSIPLGIPTADNVLNFAVQARVAGGAATQGIGEFHFDIVASGEPDSNGTLTRMLVSNVDGTYAVNTAQSSNNVIGRGGLAAQYTYLASSNPDFNGLINTSGGTFTNNPASHEVGMIGGRVAGAALLLRSDLNLDGNPDTYPGTGTFAAIDPTYGQDYLGAGGNFVDVFRFKYTLNNLVSTRGFVFNLSNLSAQIATGFELVNGTWQPVLAPSPFSATSSPSYFLGFPSPGAGSTLAIAGLLAARRRRRSRVVA